MRHIVTHAQDGRIQMAVVDDDTGELTQVGQFVWPEGFGLAEAGILSTNLTAFFQLNGAPKRKAKQHALPPGDQPSLLDDEAEPPRRTNASRGRPRAKDTPQRQARVRDYLANHPHATIGEMGRDFGMPDPSNSWLRKTLMQLVTAGVAQRHGRGAHNDPASKPFTYTLVEASTPEAPPGAAGSGNGSETVARSLRAKPKAANKTLRYISDDEVLDVINQYPDGITPRQIGERIWRATDGRGADDEEVPRWATRAVENRLNIAEAKARKGKGELAYRVEYREGGRGPNKRAKYLRPLGG